MFSTQELQSYKDLGSRLGKEIGAKLADKLESLGVNQPTPLQFKGGVPFAALSEDEAAEFADLLPYVGEYCESVEAFASGGLSLEAYMQSRLRDERGHSFPGRPDTISDTLKSAMQKQSALFAAKYPVRHVGFG